MICSCGYVQITGLQVNVVFGRMLAKIGADNISISADTAVQRLTVGISLLNDLDELDARFAQIIAQEGADHPTPEMYRVS